MAEKIIVCSEKDPRDIYKLLVGCIGPRPIGWISTISSAGIPNLAPYSFFNMFGMNPAVIGFSASLRRDLTFKDSLLNVQETSCFVHNVVTRELVEKMNATSEEVGRDVNEFERAGLTPAASQMISAPRVKEASINLECRLLDIISLGKKAGNGQLVLGEVLMMHINDSSLLAEDGFIDANKLPLVSRLGRTDYMDFGRVFSIPRP